MNEFRTGDQVMIIDKHRNYSQHPYSSLIETFASDIIKIGDVFTIICANYNQSNKKIQYLGCIRKEWVSYEGSGLKLLSSNFNIWF